MNKIVRIIIFLTIGIVIGHFLGKWYIAHAKDNDSSIEDDRVVLQVQSWQADKDGKPTVVEQTFWTEGFEHCNSIAASLMTDAGESVMDFLCVRADAWAKAGHELPTEKFPYKVPDVPMEDPVQIDPEDGPSI